MRIGFDITCLKEPMGGYERYVRALLSALVEHPGTHEMVVFSDRGYGTRLVPRGPHVEHHEIATLPLFLLKVLFQDQTYWPALFRSARLDVTHSPVFAGMVRPPRPYVLTLHDLLPLRLPETLSRTAAWYWRTILPRAVAHADVIITDSEFSRDEIRSHFNLAADRVIAVPLGVEPHFRRRHDASELARVRARYRLPDEFLLSVGVASPRKNVDQLVRAFTALPARVRGAVELVLVGPAGWRDRALQQAITEAGPSRVHRLTLVPDEDLPALYSLARGAVCLSSYEGFGLPALEALACETPLLCAAAGALPEVVGDCALLVEPRDSDAVVEGLARLLSSDPGHAVRRVGGLARAANFTWQRTAEATLALYRTVG